MNNANLKNEVTIEIGGREITLRPSFGCMTAIEQKAKKSLLNIIEDANNGKGFIADMVIVIREGTRAAGQTMKDEEIQELLETAGILTVQMALVPFFVMSLYGGKQLEAQQKKTLENPTDLTT